MMTKVHFYPKYHQMPTSSFTRSRSWLPGKGGDQGKFRGEGKLTLTTHNGVNLVTRKLNDVPQSQGIAADQLFLDILSCSFLVPLCEDFISHFPSAS